MSLPSGSRDVVRIVLGVLLILLLISGALGGPVAFPARPDLGDDDRRRDLAVDAAVAARAGGPAQPGRGSDDRAVVRDRPRAARRRESRVGQQAARLSGIKVAEIRIPMPPVWIEGVPVVGATLTAEWRVYAAATPEELASKAAPYVTTVVSWIADRAGTFGTFLLHMVLTLLLCAVLYVNGETAALGVRRFARRLMGEAGDHLVLLAAGSIRAVALGIVVTAIVQTALGAVGLVVAGAPFVAIFQP